MVRDEKSDNTKKNIRSKATRTLDTQYIPKMETKAEVIACAHKAIQTVLML